MERNTSFKGILLFIYLSRHFNHGNHLISLNDGKQKVEKLIQIFSSIKIIN